ncbi:putative acid anhydride hydrolase ASCRUDRAFT_22644, partial [Ascoidea rubescens DSM 1968]
LQADLYDQLFPNNPSTLHFQKFYITEEDLLIGIAAYKTNSFRYQIYKFLSILSLGLFYLFTRWFTNFKINFIGEKTSLAKAEWVVVESQFGDLNIIKVNRTWYNRNFSTIFNLHQNSNLDLNIPILISLDYRYFKLIFNPIDDLFTTNTNWFDSKNWSSIKNIKNGIYDYNYDDRRLVFGSNSLSLIEKSSLKILLEETLHPFYVFQVFSIILWLLDDYYYYAFCIFIISIISILDSLYETKTTMKKLKEISDNNNDVIVRVKRNEFWKETSVDELVPGDIYELNYSNSNDLSIVPCDSILLTGDCIINESMLTGESVPIPKIPITDDVLLNHVSNLKSSFITKNQIDIKLAKSYLFSGTKIIRVRRSKFKNEPALALVTKIGFSTTKGSLLRSMLFPKPVDFKFYKDSFKYIGFMCVIALIGFATSIANFIKMDIDTKTIWLRALDIITIVVPPALPATLTIGTSFAINRLKNKNIFCISPSKVNVAGKIDVFCFDKTGTLTEDGLDILGIHSTSIKRKNSNKSSISFGPLIKDINDLFQNENLNYARKSLNDYNSMNFLLSLCCCHSLRKVDNELIGDPLDYKMFEFTKWNYIEDYLVEQQNEEPIIYSAIVKPTIETCLDINDQNNYFGIVKSYEFIPSLRRMSVICKPIYGDDTEENNAYVFTKGAPEVILGICNRESLPEDYNLLLHKYTHNGYRVIACAYKRIADLPTKLLDRKDRREVESNLNFLGFIIFENKLKSQTTPTLHELNQVANIRTIMCTGDNILTAISVAKECELVSNSDDFKIYIPRTVFNENYNSSSILWENVDEPKDILDSVTLAPIHLCYSDYCLAVTGDVFRFNDPNNQSNEFEEKFSQDYIRKILMKANIFARMSPDEKHELVEQLQKLDYTVGFCGDGANDCGALKAADVGISLSEAEASVAAPFTSTVFEISCVLDLMKEGRAALVTSFSCFKYMSLYSAIQFVTISILYKKGSNLGDFQFLWIDLFLILPIAIFMSWSKPYEKLVKKRPTANLVSPKILIPLVGNIVIVIIFQFIIWKLVQKEEWYIKPIPGGDDAVDSSDNTVLFLFSNFEYILAAIILTQGPPYRESSLNNMPFVLNVSIAILFSIGLVYLNADSKLGGLMQLTYTSNFFKIFIITFSGMN